MGKEGQIVPKMTDEVVQLISDRYIELYENILGKKFIPKSDEVDMEKSIIDFLGHAS
jgi:phosphoribosylaminoimidazole-succinocarboxamide synthase